ncbi:hypothetical protein CEQ21_15850 [Niallia circulans]|uniref:Uncharacterized protein n=1 Tax=Niallia circulans TaxID=1397 RepID=A0A553SJ03_NIACI|nr:hypothetical protein [Niallia circulans]TRZ36969.1 hypothetical protein CEQ21_15850 [Niallia circulans]
MRKWAVIVMVALFLTGCSSETYENDMKAAKTAIESGDLKKALLSLELALEQKPKDNAARDLHKRVSGLMDIKTAIDNGNWSDALAKASQLAEDGKVDKDLDTLLDKYLVAAEANANE